MATAISHCHSRNADGTWNVHDVPIFMTHGRGGRTVGVDELDNIVAATNSSDRVNGAPKLVIDHPSFEGSPVIGRGKNLRRVDQVIIADFLNIRPRAFREIVKGAFPQWSVGLDFHTMQVIEHIAFLGSVESFFPFSAISCSLSEDEEAQLLSDIEADVSFTFSRGKREQLVHYSMFSGRKAMQKLFRKDSKGKLIAVPKLFNADGTQFMIEPDDAAQIVEIVQEQTAPIKEALAVLTSRLDALDGKGEEEEEATEEETTDEETESQKDGEEEKDDKKTDSSRDLKALEETIKAEKKAADLESQAYRRELTDKVSAVIDSRRYVNAKKLVEDHVDRIYSMSNESDREAALAMVLDAYKANGAHFGRLPSTTTTKGKADGADEALEVATKFMERVKARGQKSFAHFSASEPEKLAAYLRTDEARLAQMKATLKA